MNDGLARAQPALRMHHDTIAAIATPLGEGGLAVIRISGHAALGVADACFRPAGTNPSVRTLAEAPSHTVHFGHVHQQGRVLDEVLAVVMRAPRTFTREDVVELSCHGGVVVTRSVLGAVLASGARLAEPGEFTRRAFLNGRIDLAQAEAVADIIHARTGLALMAAEEQLAGRLSRRVEELREDLLGVLAHIEAHINFPEEDIAPDTRERLESRLARALSFVDALLATAHEGQMLRRGVRAVILGRPNAGKSSLLNLLLGRDRAIVSPLPGTTRDTIEETADIRGLPVVLIDTAGLREVGDAIEREGVRRSHSSVEQAELVLHVLDGSEPFTDEDAGHLARWQHKPRLIVLNKCDLPPRLALPPGLEAMTVRVCALSGEGLETLKDAIRDRIWSGHVPAEMHEAMINARHEDALRRARGAAQRTLTALRDGLPLELVALDLRVCLNAVGEIVGKTTTEDLLDQIFRQFCIGK